MSFDMDPMDEDPHAECAAEIRRLQEECRSLREENHRLNGIARTGFDPEKVLEWLDENPRRQPLIAFTSGGERVCADLIEIAERKLLNSGTAETEE